MDIAILILVIVALILLCILTFFVFQIWVQSKEFKILMAHFSSEFIDLKSKIKDLENLLDEIGIDLIEQIDEHFEKSNTHTIENIDILKKKTSSDIDGLTDGIKIFKENFESRIRELDNNISDKLVNDLTYITSNYARTLQEELDKVLDRFSKTTKEIDKKHGDILKAITEPLKINLEDND